MCGHLLLHMLCISQSVMEEWCFFERGGAGDEHRSAVGVPPQQGPSSSMKGYVSFLAANPPACLCLTFTLLLTGEEHTVRSVSSQ